MKKVSAGLPLDTPSAFWRKFFDKNEKKIVGELNSAQGKELDLGGYYQPDDKKITEAMRPSATLNALLSAFCR